MEDLVVRRDGKFSFTIGPKELSRGVRPKEGMHRDNKYLVYCSGIVGKNGTLATLDPYETQFPSITDAFPYPQVFKLTNFTLLCGKRYIWEVPNGATLDDAVNVFYCSTIGNLWSVLDYHDYLYLSNGRVNIVRDPATGNYAYDMTIPTAIAACNYNGQALIGGINIDSVLNDTVFT